MRKSLFVILVLFSFFPFFLHALPALELEDNSERYNNFIIEKYFQTDETNLSISSLKNMPFEKNSNNFSLSFHQHPIWFRFKVHNKHSKSTQMVLEVSEPFHKNVDLYLGEKAHLVEKNGLSVPLSQRSIHEYNPAFSLHFKAGEVKTIYLKVSSNYGFFGAIKLKTPEAFKSDTQLYNNFIIFYFGAVLIIALYNLFIYFYLREKIYLYYVSYVLFFATWVSLYSGVALSFVNMHIYDLLQISVPAFLIMLTLFSQSILEMKTYFPKINRFLKQYILLIFLSLLGILVSLNTGFHIMNILATPLLPTLLLISIFASLQGHKIAKIYTLALVTFFIGMSLVSLLSLSLLPYNSFIRNAPILGSAFEIVLFSLALAYRINLLRHEKLSTQAILLEHERTESSRLAQMVSEKTLALQEANAQLQHQASTDSLTGILNRKSFFEHCAQEVERVKRYPQELSFLIIDIDLFKNVNDTYGHLVGDEVLTCVTKEISLQLRNSDIFGRIGGEEFAILMPNTTLEHAQSLADRIRRSISACKIHTDNDSICTTVSIGLSQYIQGEEVIQLALKRADEALYSAKENGRNQVQTASV